MEGRVDGLRIVLLGIVLDGEGRREDLPRELGVVAFATAPRLLARAEAEEKSSSQGYVA